MTEQRGSRRPVRVDRFVGQLRGQFACMQGHEGGTVDLDQPLVRDAAPLDLGQREKVVGVLQEGIAQLAETPAALLGWGAGPGPVVERPSRGADRGIDVVDIGLGSLGDRLFGGR